MIVWAGPDKIRHGKVSVYILHFLRCVRVHLKQRQVLHKMASCVQLQVGSGGLLENRARSAAN